MTEDLSRKIACELLTKENAAYEKYIGATRITKDGRDIWVVYFDTRKPEDVVLRLPQTIIVLVDDLTGEAEIFPSL